MKIQYIKVTNLTTKAITYYLATASNLHFIQYLSPELFEIEIVERVGGLVGR
jgi:hypothetical protein